MIYNPDYTSIIHMQFCNLIRILIAIPHHMAYNLTVLSHHIYLLYISNYLKRHKIWQIHVIWKLGHVIMAIFICKTDWTAFVAILLIAVHLSFKKCSHKHKLIICDKHPTTQQQTRYSQQLSTTTSCHNDKKSYFLIYC